MIIDEFALIERLLLLEVLLLVVFSETDTLCLRLLLAYGLSLLIPLLEVECEGEVEAKVEVESEGDENGDVALWAVSIGREEISSLIPLKLPTLTLLFAMLGSERCFCSNIALGIEGDALSGNRLDL